jgi:hypothetical protein
MDVSPAKCYAQRKFLANLPEEDADFSTPAADTRRRVLGLNAFANTAEEKIAEKKVRRRARSSHLLVSPLGENQPV